MNTAELVKALRWNGKEYKGSIMDEEDKLLYLDAADAIEAQGKALDEREKQIAELHPEQEKKDGRTEISCCGK